MSHGRFFLSQFSLGPFIIFIGQFVHLLPFYFTLNALILAGRHDAEWILRSALLKSMVIAGVAEICWSTLCWNVSHKTCGILTFLAAFLQAFQMWDALSPRISMRISLGASSAFIFQCATQMLMIPVAQLGSQHTSKQGISPARYKIMAWLLSVMLAILLLLFPFLAHFCLVLPCVVFPYVALGTATFLCFPTLDSTRTTRSTGSLVSVGAATGFGVLGVLSGTLGEALTDSATTLTLRRELKAGHRDLALANHLTVLSSMSLAFWTQSKSESTNKQVLCMLLWAGCQVFRTAALPYLATESERSAAGHERLLALAAMVFLDKYTGPLGAASLDSALLTVLYHGRASRGLPETVLWTMRTAVSRMERPICQLIMLHASLEVEILALIFTLMTSIGVLTVLRCCEAREARCSKRSD